MARANASYYAERDPFADFTTAPEIGQVFGELLGAWAAVAWHSLGCPDPVMLAELGPGRGTLMVDALRLIGRTAPDFAAALRLVLVETSPRLRAVLRARLPAATILSRVDEIDHAPTIVLANEFLDALPIRQFVRRGDGWTERHVECGRFVECHAHEPPVAADGLRDGDVVERNDEALSIVRMLAAGAAAGRLTALLIDYGDRPPDEAGRGDTLQALRGARPGAPLDDPGTADLTAHVDFEPLRTTAREAGAHVHGPLPQGLFLTRLGLYERTRQLAASSPVMVEAANRLAQPERMGVLFKAFAITPPAWPVPPGFEAPGPVAPTPLEAR